MHLGVDSDLCLRYMYRVGSNEEGFGMYALQVLNSNDEWELIVYLFKSEAEAVDFYHKNLSVFDDYEVTEMQIRG